MKKVTVLRLGGMRVKFEVGRALVKGSNRNVWRFRYMNGDDTRYGDLDSTMQVSKEDAEHDIQDLLASGYTIEKQTA